MNLLKYLPPYLQEYRELIDIMTAENPEIDDVRASINLILSNQFINTLTEYGCEKWETFLNIEPYPEDTLSIRRFRIMSKLLSDVPYTERKLRNFLDTTCGEQYYSLTMHYNEYGIEIWIDVESMQERDIVIKTLKTWIPANLVLDVQIYFRTHGWLNENKLTHGAMRAYTHKGIRVIVLG